MATRLELETQLRAHWPRLRRFAFTLSRDPADADDLVQDSAMRMLASASQWEAGTRFDSWMFRVTRNLWIDTVRSRGRRQARQAPAELAETVGVDPRPAIEASLDLATAMAAMQQIPDEQREIVSLVLIEGFGYREVAEMLDLPIGTVSSRLARGRTALMHILGEKA